MVAVSRQRRSGCGARFCRGSLFLRRRRREGFPGRYVAGGTRALASNSTSRSLPRHPAGSSAAASCWSRWPTCASRRRRRASATPRCKVGTTGGGVSSVLSRMPHKIAMEFLLVGEEMSAERAYQIGFVNKVVPKGQHVVLAQEMAAKIAAAAPLVVQALKKLARDAMPKGPLETVAEVRRLLDPVRDQRRPQGRRQGVQRKAQASVQGEVRTAEQLTQTACDPRPRSAPRSHSACATAPAPPSHILPSSWQTGRR